MFCCLKLKKIAVYVLAVVVLVSVIFGVIKVSASVIKESNSINVPIIMYHSVLKDDTKSCDYVVTPAVVEKDLIYLQDNGYTTIMMSDLINYVYNGTPLPEKPVILTFDDGMTNNLTYVLPLLEKYNMKAVFSVVGEYSQKFSDNEDKNPAYAYMSWSDIASLKKSGRVEVGNHSYAMHNNDSSRQGSRINNGESFDDYQNVFICDTMKLQTALKKKCGISTEFYTFPYGFYCKEATKILKCLGFKATLTCDEKPNHITRDTECLYGLNRYNRPSGISTEKFMKKALS